ncbi:Endonuclease, Uma2 family (restriction endonuclease fold) [Abditibacterium utsteinense]|uniref:Endonuclease, Uma2 family (Restriction endonuclease fold) n=1 Tax=Abditibacterium utsteinense TaxID=1960156 RepID=A0A2S8SWF3_9BACT|nr:Uma2 family endonuclease [Abditibacterium utsteinense]PQV65136.1 Endonuclease, Uma2 family (restriction endonuclease fold) [Abditibacterium utsteinense]
MSAQKQPQWISEAEYRDGEEISPVKHEWFAGEVFAMAGVTLSHATLCTNTAASAKAALRGRRCTALGGEMRVKVEANGLHTYPDALIFCENARFEGRGDNTLLTPKVIFEVLSPSTERYDRGDKFTSYAQIETLTDYVLIETERVAVEHFQRAPEGWLLRSYGQRDDVLRFPDLEIELPLSEIYEDLDVPDRRDAPQLAPRRDED